MLDNYHESSTQSSEDERAFQSNIRMIQSEQFTPQIAVNYLFKWRFDSKYIQILLNRLFELCLRESMHYIPTIMYNLPKIQIHHEPRKQRSLRKLLLTSSQTVILTLSSR